MVVFTELCTCQRPQKLELYICFVEIFVEEV